MNAARLFILVIAAIAAIVLAFVVRGAFAPKKTAPAPAVAEAPASAPVARVLVAKRDLPVGARLVAADMGWQEWPASGLNPAYVTDGAPPAPKETGAAGAVKEAATAAGGLMGDPALQGFVGAVVREAFFAGEPIVARKTLKAGEGNFMSVVVRPGHRAMAIPVSADSAAGGFILPGDRVDLLLSKGGDSGKAAVTRTVLRNIRVLAIDQTAKAEPEAKALVGGVATLEVAASEAEVVAGAQAQAKSGAFLSLALRSYADAGGPTGRGSGAAASGESVRVWRAGQVSEVVVTQ
ncbi:Flp pilus assembly protein CpaB [Caulobacter mirabilis]|uniref:Flp pilus assembly protein CpaB n=1 Tax=Caulobacter mirabilis TaxID=69666 RepID=A0A2D2ASE7_9CAUL|nr:Flp pilus assembly protein CpaB [Caulobacter mirabilis]ATQ40938.1 Flp pilus assembly protein CpaB [Caulobacter mirabilis]